MFVLYEKVSPPIYPNGKADNSHFSEEGARAVAKRFADRLRELITAFPLDKK
ncbi:hypothetical protein P0Y35_06310 [Kiritimatiellaeota bacterium B1221]|nr:hypothetical protein [Kiritimatiellaeota bacterium B1221]